MALQTVFHLIVSEEGLFEPYIETETILDAPDPESRWDTVRTAPLGKSNFFEADLLATPEGRRALERWRAGDHSQAEERERLRDAEMAYFDLQLLIAHGTPGARELLESDPELDEVIRFIEEDAERSYRERHSED